MAWSQAGLPVLCVLLIISCSCSFATAASSSSSEKAFLVVDKRATLSKVKSGERVTVSISLYNAGSSTAYDVSLSDDTWPVELFTIVNGGTSPSWEKLDAGTSVAHDFVLEPKVQGPFSGSPATVKYRMAAKSSWQEGYSTPIPELDILSNKPAVNRFEWLKAFGVKYGPLLIVVTVVGAFIGLLVSPSKPKKFSKGGKKRR